MCFNNQNDAGSQNNGNNSLENNNGSIGSNNVGSAFPQSNGADNQDYVVLGLDEILVKAEEVPKLIVTT